MQALFIPAKVDEESRPCSVKEIGNVRISEGTSRNGEMFRLQDYWRAAKRPHQDMKEAWVGHTRFVHEHFEDSVIGSSMRTLPIGGSNSETDSEGRRGSIRPLEERTVQAQKYYSTRDPEASMPGRTEASESHPSDREGDQHGLGHHGGPAESSEGTERPIARQGGSHAQPGKPSRTIRNPR